ncbi:unnamed protein product [Prorocentrum cordatum]|uniref:Glycerate kinase n=1 Tax=Prorocentrum cordatum TaxID=2364126 RepID=A0ABN9W9J1_9DINO|nr:unnamed protein product [Polarella glacialis]
MSVLPPPAAAPLEGALPRALVEEVGAFVRAGPLHPSLRGAAPAAEAWALRGARAVARLAGEAAAADPSPSRLGRDLAARVYHLYLPVYFWLLAEVNRARAAPGRAGAVLLGLSAPQGCGKTTLVGCLADLFSADGLSCVAVSYDDFYLTGAEQDAVTERCAGNALLRTRGNAGTHDIALGAATLRALCGAEAGSVPVPGYDKAARAGRGDRAPRSAWRSASAPLDVVLLEGWMAGFRQRGDGGVLSATHSGLPDIDANLTAYVAWEDLVDAWCVVAVDDIERVYGWRLQAERAMAAEGRPGMDDEAVRAFVAGYMPAYEAYCPALWAASAPGGGGLDGKPTLLLCVDGDRAPVELGARHWA